MAAVSNIRKSILFVIYTIFTCNTSNITQYYSFWYAEFISDAIFIIGVNTHAYLLTKSTMAAVGNIGKAIFVVSYTIFTCDTSNFINFGMQNSFLKLFSSLGVNTHAYLLTKYNMAVVGHIGIVIFVSYTIFTCSTSKVTNFGM